jgi:hypothetical protein
MSSGRSPPFFRDDLSTYPLDGDLVVFDERRGSLFALNSTAAFIWMSLASGFDAAATASELAGATGVPTARATLDIELLIRQWREAKLLRDPSPGLISSSAVRNPHAAGARRAPRTAAIARYVRLMDRGIRVSGDADTTDALDSVFGEHFVPSSQASAEWPTLAIVKDGNRWTLLLEDAYLADCGDRAELVPMLYGNAAKLIYEAADCFAAVHAAAVAKGSRCVLMPAVSTSGKSTLTAALVASGYDYCTDDLAILTPAPVGLRPVPMQIGLKTGSWNVLAALCPELAAATAHRRADGQWVKYLQPRAHGTPRSSDERLQVAAVVFPKFMAGAGAELRPLSRAAALARMTEAGYDLSGKLDRRAVEVLVQWFATLNCFELQFDDLREAVELFAHVLA